MEGFTKQGQYLVPGKNVDRLDIAAGLGMARQIGYGDGESVMVLTYALQRHSRGEEDGAEKTIKGHIDFTSWRMVLAAAMAAANPPPPPLSDDEFEESPCPPSSS